MGKERPDAGSNGVGRTASRGFATLIRVLSCVSLSLVLFDACFGRRILSGDWEGWLHTSSREQYQGAWLAYRHAPWSFPLGFLPIFFSPHGSSVAFMDGVPWFLTMMKLLGPILPEHFSAWGWWILVCCVLQVWMARLLMERLSADEVSRWVGTVFISFCPVLVGRSVHLSLLSHWVVLAAWSLFFAKEPEERPRWYWAALIAIVSGTHPYLLAMILAIRVWALIVSRAPLQERVYDLLLMVSVTVLVMLVFGYFQNGNTKDVGADRFEADLSALVLSFGTGSLWPSFASFFGEDEGYAYLGAGGIVLAAGAIFSLFGLAWFGPPGRTTERDSWLLKRSQGALLLSVMLFAFALGPAIRLCGAEIGMPGSVSNPLYRFLLIGPLQDIPGIFRAPGRFIWPLYYLLLALGARSLNGNRVFALAVLALQVADTGAYVSAKHSRMATGSLPPLFQDQHTHRKLLSARMIELVPAEPRELCDLDRNAEGREILKEVMLVAAERQIPMNSGLQARVPLKRLRGLCADELREFRAGHFAEGHFYVVDEAIADTHPFEDDGRLVCHRAMGFAACSPAGGPPIGAALPAEQLPARVQPPGP